MFLVQAIEDYTNGVLPSYTKLFQTRSLAETYARIIVADKCGFDTAVISELKVEDDPAV